jgi:hypothetical protein
MNALIKIAILLPLLFSHAFSANDELSFLSGKIEVYLEEKGWLLESSLEINGIAYHQWRHKDQYVKVSFFYCKTGQDTADRLQSDMKGIIAELGAGKRVSEIGDEAFEWETAKANQALVYVRKNRILLAVCAPSIGEARGFAKLIAGIPGSDHIARAARS